jgi:hypothetical protein
MPPQFFARGSVERVNARAGRSIGTSDDYIVRDEGIAVKEVLGGVRANLGFPAYSACLQFERPENAVARTDEDQITYDRRCMRKSATGLKVPQR